MRGSPRYHPSRRRWKRYCDGGFVYAMKRWRRLIGALRIVFSNGPSRVYCDSGNVETGVSMSHTAYVLLHWRRDEVDDLPIIAAIDTEVLAVNC